MKIGKTSLHFAAVVYAVLCASATGLTIDCWNCFRLNFRLFFYLSMPDGQKLLYSNIMHLHPFALYRPVPPPVGRASSIPSAVF